MLKVSGDNGKEFLSDNDASSIGVLEAPVSETKSDNSGSSNSSFSLDKLPIPPSPATEAAVKRAGGRECHVQ